jgi:hypothetical protein
LTARLQINASAVTVKLVWIKVKKPIATIRKFASANPKKKYMSLSTRKRNAKIFLTKKK